MYSIYRVPQVLAMWDLSTPSAGYVGSKLSIGYWGLSCAGCEPYRVYRAPQVWGSSYAKSTGHPRSGLCRA